MPGMPSTLGQPRRWCSGSLPAARPMPTCMLVQSRTVSDTFHSNMLPRFCNKVQVDALAHCRAAHLPSAWLSGLRCQLPQLCGASGGNRASRRPPRLPQSTQALPERTSACACICPGHTALSWMHRCCGQRLDRCQACAPATGSGSRAEWCSSSLESCWSQAPQLSGSRCVPSSRQDLLALGPGRGSPFNAPLPRSNASHATGLNSQLSPPASAGYRSLASSTAPPRGRWAPWAALASQGVQSFQPGRALTSCSREKCQAVHAHRLP